MRSSSIPKHPAWPKPESRFHLNKTPAPKPGPVPGGRRLARGFPNLSPELQTSAAARLWQRL